MWLGYNTNGFAHHRLDDAIRILADLGYEGVAVTLDYHSLDPFDPATPREAERIRRLLDDLRMKCVVETGARFLLDARRKHQPALISPTPDDRDRRLEFLRRSIELAAILGSGVVSFWSGTPADDAGPAEWMRRLVDGCRSLGARLAFEPEPGMFIDTMERFAELHDRVNRPNFGLTLDIGHLQCLGEFPIRDHIVRWHNKLWNVHIEDMKQGKHDHLMFGEGDIDFAEVFAALREIGYDGGVCVELSRHSHDAVETARRSIAFLRQF